MGVIFSFYVVPIKRTGSPSVSDIIAKVVEKVKNRAVDFIVTPASTVFEVESLREGLDIIEEAIGVAKESGAVRIITEIKIDMRFDKELKLREMPEKIYSKLGM